jgi:hypothetical protein
VDGCGHMVLIKVVDGAMTGSLECTLGLLFSFW